METTPKNFAQIGPEWILKVEHGINLKPGPGIKIDPDGDGFKVSVDQDAFKQWLWAAIKGGLYYCPPGGAGPCTPGVQLSNLGSLLLDPGL